MCQHQFISHLLHLQLWLDEDVDLYDFAKVRPLIKKKQVKVQSLFFHRDR